MLSAGTPTPQAIEESAERSWQRIRSRVNGVRTRNRMKYAGTGLLVAGAVFVAAFLGFSAADIVFKLSVGSRVFVLLSTVIAIAFALFHYVYRPWSRLGNTVQSARDVEGAFPQLEQQLSTALEFGADKEKARKFASPVLVAALVTQAGERSEPLDFARTIRWKQLLWAFGIAFALALLMAVYANKNRRLFGITWARFMKPTADIAAPTLTEIKEVKPGDDKAELESSVEIKVQLDGKLPETATLSVLIGDEKEGRWEDRPMDRGEDGYYKATLRRLLDTARYKIQAGDTESREFKIKVYKKPEISEFALSIEHPAYTGKGIEPLPPGTGDVHALRGSKIHVDIKSNVDLSQASIAFKSGRAEISGALQSTEPRKASLVFDVDKDDDYQIKIADSDGNPGTSERLFQVRALKDRYPRVTIKKPEKDLMVHREQTVEVEISADDDIGVREIGIFHSLGLDEKQLMVRRMDPAISPVSGKLVWELGTMELKGGEVIAYYAYAQDNDTVSKSGPKMSKSDIHFLTVYDEEKYDQEKDPQKKKQQQGTPPEIKQLDKLIDVQKKLLKETFSQSRLKDSLRDKEEADRAKALDGEKISANKTADGQRQLRARVEALIDEVKKELEREENPEEVKPKEGDPPQPDRQKPALGEKELKHLEEAVAKMRAAETELMKAETPTAVKPENEALRHLSETRRLLLSDKEGDPRFKMAMNKNAKKNQKKDQEQQQQDQQQAKQELAEMPKMMDREKELERDIEELQEKKQKPPQGEPQSEERKQQEDEKRQLQKKAEDEAEKLAKEAEERARKLEDLANRNLDMKPAADKMRDAADKLDQANKDLKQQNKEQNAKDQNREAQKDSKDAQRNLRNALEKAVRQELANAEKDARELAENQQKLSQEMQQAQNQPQPNGQKQDAQKQDGQKQDGQKQDGQKQDGQKQDGQKQDGQKQDGQKQDGQKQDGQPQSGQKQDGQQQSGQPQSGQKQDGQKQDGQPQSGQRGNQRSAEQRARDQADNQAALKELNEKLKKLADKTNQEGLGGAKEVEQAERQSSEGSAANQAAEKAAQAMSSSKNDEAAREAANAAKAMQQLAEKLQDAKQKTDAGDMKQLASAIKKLQGAQKDQADINKDLGDKDKRDTANLPAREEKVGDTAKEVADAASRMATLRQQGAHDTAKQKLESAAKNAADAAQAMRERNDSAAKAAADKTENALNQAISDMERASGKTMEDKAREAKAMAKAAKENQEKADKSIMDVPNKENGAKLDTAEAAKRDEAAANQEKASADAKRLDLALDGLKELAKEANPAAADAAKEARETTQKTELPKSMDKNAADMKRIGTDKKPEDPASAKTPVEAAKKGEEMVQTLNKVDKHLDEFVAEARNSLEERYKKMEDAARDAAAKAKALAEMADPNSKQDEQKNQDQKNAENKTDQANNPQSKPNPNKVGEPKTSDQAKVDDPAKADPNRTAKPNANKGEQNSKPSEQEMAQQEEQLEKDLKKLQSKLERLGPDTPEKLKMKDALAALQKDKKNNENKSAKPDGPPQPGEKNMGGATFKRVNKNMEDIAQGILERHERLLRERDIRPDEDEDAPREYRTLVDRYYRALSEDMNEEERR